MIRTVYISGKVCFKSALLICVMKLPLHLSATAMQTWYINDEPLCWCSTSIWVHCNIMTSRTVGIKTFFIITCNIFNRQVGKIQYLKTMWKKTTLKCIIIIIIVILGRLWVTLKSRGAWTPSKISTVNLGVNETIPNNPEAEY